MLTLRIHVEGVIRDTVSIAPNPVTEPLGPLVQCFYLRVLHALTSGGLTANCAMRHVSLALQSRLTGMHQAKLLGWGV